MYLDKDDRSYRWFKTYIFDKECIHAEKIIVLFSTNYDKTTVFQIIEIIKGIYKCFVHYHLVSNFFTAVNKNKQYNVVYLLLARGVEYAHPYLKIFSLSRMIKK